MDKIFKKVSIYIDKIHGGYSRKVWTACLQIITKLYSQCLIIKCRKIKTSSLEKLKDKLEADKQKLQDTFGEVIGKIQLKNSLSLLGNLEEFFETSPPFIAKPCMKLRHDLGPGFTFKMAKQLIKMRTDLDKEEKKLIFENIEQALKSQNKKED